MRRVNGYLDLDDYFLKKLHLQSDEVFFGYEQVLYNKYKFLRFSDYANSHYWLTIEGKEYYFKPTAGAYKEIVASKLAKSIGLNAVNYDFAIFSGIPGAISESFINKGSEYFSGEDLLKIFFTKNKDFLKNMGMQDFDDADYEYCFNVYGALNNLEIIWPMLEELFPNNKNDIQKVMKDITDLFVFKIFIHNADAESYNWQLEKTKDGKIRLAPIYDNEDSFVNGLDITRTTVSLDSDYLISNNLKEYITKSSDEFVDRFLELFAKFSDVDNFYMILDEIEQECGSELENFDKPSIIAGYLESISEIKKVLSELDLNTGRRSNG